MENAERYDPLLNECMDFALDIGSHPGYLANKRLRVAGREIEASCGFRLLLVIATGATGERPLPPSVLSKVLLLNFATTEASFALSVQ